MTRKTLITSPRITPDANALMQAAKEVGQPTIRLSSFRPTPEVENIPIAIYGESLFAIILSSALNHRIIEPTLDWLTNLPQHYTQREIIHMTMGEARQIQTPRFVKNSDGMKAFEAKVYASGDDLPSSEFYPDDYEVLVSEPVHWEVEYRCFIMEHSIKTMAIYLKDGELAKSTEGEWLHDEIESAEAKAFCETLLADDSAPIPPACVIDVGRIHGRGWAVVEANPAYGSGIYGCDPRKALEVVNRTTIHADGIQVIDEKWITHYEVDN